jgi:hypothetical protein
MRILNDKDLNGYKLTRSFKSFALDETTNTNSQMHCNFFILLSNQLPEKVEEYEKKLKKLWSDHLGMRPSCFIISN